MNADLRVDQAALKALLAALRKADPALQKQLKGELKKIAGVISVSAKGKVPSRSGRAAGSIRPGVTSKGAYVQGGKAGVPYYGWLDFGQRKPISGRSRSVGPWKASGKGPKHGRFIYVALDENRDEITTAVRRAVTKSIDQLF